MADHTFTFTDAELQSLLSCIDEGTFEAGGGGGALQFLPPEQPAVFVPTNLSDPQPLGGSLHQAPLSLPPLAAPKHQHGPQGRAANGASAADPFALGSAPRRVHVHQPPAQQQRRQQPSLQRAAATAAQAPASTAARASAAAAATSAAKQPHSIVEKQRRDRINTLIDEVRGALPANAVCLPALPCCTRLLLQATCRL